MCCFFNKRATIVDVTDKEVIDLFQDGRYHRRTFEDFGRRHLSSITKLKDMITSWPDEEDKANAKYDSIHGKSKHNMGGNNNNTNNNNNRDQGVVTTTTTQVLIASASQTTQSRLFSALRKTTRKRPLAASKTCSKRSGHGIWRATIPPSSATNSGEHSKTLDPRPPHDKKGKKKADEGNSDFEEPEKTVNVLFSGLPTKRSQKATRREVLNIEPAVPTPLRWSEVPITFFRVDQ
jgi:hypothetical protein